MGPSMRNYPRSFGFSSAEQCVGAGEISQERQCLEDATERVFFAPGHIRSLDNTVRIHHSTLVIEACQEAGEKKGSRHTVLDLSKSGREDLNLRPLVPHTSALPGCATPRILSN